MRKRILFFGHLPPPSSGEGNILKSFFQSLPKSKYELRLLDTQLRDAQEAPASMTLYNITRTIKHVWSMFWICLTWQPHYVHIFLTAGPAVLKFGLLNLIARSMGARVIANHQSGLIISQYDDYGTWKRSALRWILRLPKAWIATSHGWSRWLLEHSVESGHIRIIPNAVKMEMARAFRDFNRLAREPEEPIRLVSVGAVGNRKGTDVLAQVCSRLHEKGIPFHMVIAGAEELPGEMERMRSLFENLVPENSYSFVGQLEYDQLVDALKAAHVFLFPTRGDNYPVAVAEAMIAGLAVVATRIGAIPEMVDNGRTGILTNVDDVDALTKATRIDLLQYGIKVSQIAPGAVETEFSEVRFHGDKQKAKEIYKGFQPLTGKDIAEVIYYVTTLPAHVNINDLLIMPTAQANATTLLKK